MRKMLVAIAVLAFITPALAAVPSGTLIKASGPAVYYVTGGKRYVFPNDRVYFSWYSDFNTVTTVSDADLASYPLGGNVTYKPGSRLVKIQSDPRVYAVGPGGALRWIANEDAARSLFGADWSQHVDDVPDALFLNYREGSMVSSTSDFDANAASAVATIELDLSSRATDAAPIASQDLTAAKTGAWSDAKTWGGKMPGTGARVVIPTGITVTIDGATPTLASIDIQGTLAFMKDADGPLSLSAKTVGVSGTLSAGTEGAPVSKSTVTINLTGIGRTPDDADGIMVRGGELALFGAAPSVPWTILAAEAKKGAKTILLTDAPDWVVGGEIVITSTSRSTAETETRTIVKIDKNTITLNKALDFTHWSDSFTRAEVGSLTRTVAVRGTGHGGGGRIVVEGGGAAQFRGVDLRGLGKDGVTGMGAVTFDGLGSASDSFIRDSVLRDDVRCLTFNRTDDASFEDNIAFGVTGSCVVTESGAETGNVIDGNLIVSVGAGSAVTNDDAPAAVLLRNPDNAISGNAVAGSAGYGYWYALPASVSKSDGTTLKPAQTALGSFNDNAVRGAVRFGLSVDDASGRMNYAPPQTAVFSGLHAVENGQGFWVRGAGIEVSDSYLGDNAVGGSFAAFGAAFKNSTVVGDPLSASSTLPTMRGFIFQDGPTLVDGVRFERFNGAMDHAAFGLQEGAPDLADPRNGYRNITFESARPWSVGVPKTFGDRLVAVRDYDAKKSVVMRAPFLGADCAYGEGGTTLCDESFAPFQITLRGVTGAHSLTVNRTDGSGWVRFDPGAAFDGQYAYLTVAEGGDYRMETPSTGHVSLSYDGTNQPVTMRFAVPSNVKVSAGTDTRWSYNATSGEVSITVAPGDDVDVTW